MTSETQGKAPNKEPLVVFQLNLNRLELTLVYNAIALMHAQLLGNSVLVFRLASLIIGIYDEHPDSVSENLVHAANQCGQLLESTQAP